MKNKYLMIAAVLIISSAAIALLAYRYLGDSHRGKDASMADASQGTQKIEYWTCSMHPSVHQDGPGKCPICGMDLIPVYDQEANKVSMDTATAKKFGVTSVPVEKMKFIKELKFPARVSHDYELYMLEQKHLSALATEKRSRAIAVSGVSESERSVLESTRLRLKLLGFDDGWIAQIEKSGKPDESLIYPSQGRAWIHADVYEQDVGYVKSGLPVKVMGQGIGGKEFSGTVVAVETVLNENTRSAKARIQVPDQDNLLKHEMYVDAILSVDLGEKLGIQRKSLIDTGTRKIVYVDVGNGKYEARQVETGAMTEDMVEITSGLKEGERVVANGNFLLDSQTSLGGGESLMYDSGKEIKENTDPGHRH